jgi:hypothetical protein
MPRSASPAVKSIQRRVTIPGILAETARLRWEEFRYQGFSPFALELACFDLRLRVPHEVTAFIAQQPEKIQAAVDRNAARQYRRGGERNGLLIQAARGEWLEPANPAPPGDFARARLHIRYSETLAPCIELRWQELGYATRSDYLTALLRYDLLLLGPHNYFSGDDTDPEILASLDRGTVREFEENRQPKRIYLDYQLEKIAGGALTQEELSARKRGVAEQIIQHALEADRKERTWQASRTSAPQNHL